MINGGSGYSRDNPPEVAITGDGVNASAMATVDENGAIRNITVTNAGSGYTSAEVVISGSGGATAKANIVGARFQGSDGLDICGNYAYVVAGAVSTLNVLDISNPDAPILTGSLTDTERLPGDYGIDVKNGYAYIAAGFMNKRGSNRFSVVDVSNPHSPVMAGSINDDVNLAGALHVSVDDKYAYVTARNANRLTVVDISNPARPRVVSSLHDDEKLYLADGLYITQQYAYVTSHQFADKAYFNVIDISDPHNLRFAGSLSSPLFLGGDLMDIEGHYAYVPGNIADDLTVVDISRPEEPRIVGNITDHEYLHGNSYTSVSNHFAYNVANFFDAVTPHRLTVVDVTDPASPRLVGSTKDPSINGYVMVSRGRAYIGGGAPHGNKGGGLAVADISEVNARAAAKGDLFFPVIWKRPGHGWLQMKPR